MEALGCGPLRAAVADSLQQAMEGTQALPMAAALAAGRLAETGALPAAGAGAAAEQVLRQLPMLTNLRSAANWDLLFQAHLGTLDAFVLAHGEPAGKKVDTLSCTLLRLVHLGVACTSAVLDSCRSWGVVSGLLALN